MGILSKPGSDRLGVYDDDINNTKVDGLSTGKI